MRYLKIKAIVILGAVILSLPGNCFSKDSSSSLLEVDLTNSWFVPSLVLDADPVCGSFLAAAREEFESTNYQYKNLPGFKRSPGPFQNFDKSDPSIQLEDDDPHQFKIKVDAATHYVKFVTHGGCGGACERDQLLVSDEKITGTQGKASTPSAPDWHLVKKSNGAFFALGNVDDHLQLYRIVSPQDWRLSCDVALKPDKPHEIRDNEVHSALKAVLSLNNRINALSGGAGDCGSMGTAWRWKRFIEEGLIETLYRPWALAASRVNNYYSENSYGDYPRINESLKLWSLGGINQYKAYASYQTQLNETVGILAQFYSKQFGWSEKVSSETAWSATTNVISDGFGFYMYDPFPNKGEQQLRAAILERKPIEEIRAIELDRKITGQAEELTGDSILNIAILYPEALRYLLAIGSSPNLPNEFGKTPLMYAVQQNQLEAAKILLAAGADPNSTTIIPSNRCEYTLKTAHMTALHYAARYASAEMIKLLIIGGANPFIQTDNPIKRDEYPIDWLRRYTQEVVAEERNPNIFPEEIEEAQNLLRLPSDLERNSIAKRMVLLAELDYTKGNIEAAYRHLQVALAAQPGNIKAISDLPLVALKAGQFGPSIKAANQAIEVLKAPAQLSAAWFNKGLVCENESARSITDYDGHKCGKDWLQPFIRAFKIEATSARTKKLKRLFDSDDANVCVIPVTDEEYFKVRYFNVMGENSIRIYVFHSANKEIDPNKVQWSVTFSGDAEATVMTAKIVEKINLDQDTITILEGTNYGLPSINGHICKEK
ncbi:MAG: ankyrin repeat domain-containing protein [Pseudomonadota bacterium]